MAQKETAAAISPGVWLPAVLVGWLIPGGGHFLLKHRIRAALIGGSVVVMFLLGLGMRGAMFVPQQGDLLTTLINYGGFVGNLCTGLLYFISTWMGYAQPDVAGHVHDYGTKFLVSAGLLNILSMVDAYELAVGKKT
jgi:hypothetical protein